MKIRESIQPLIVAAIVCAWLVVGKPVLPGSMGGQPLPMMGATSLGNGSTQFDAITLAPHSGDWSSPSSACLWYDSVKRTMRYKTAAGITSGIIVTDPSTANSATLTNPTASTTFSGTIPLAYPTLDTTGRVVRCTAWGKYTTGATLLPTVDLGWNVSGRAVASSGLISVAVGLTDKPWVSRATFVVRSTGDAGTINGLEEGALGGLLSAALPVSQIGSTAATVLNSNVDNVIAPTAKFGVSDASNAITCECVFLEILN